MASDKIIKRFIRKSIRIDFLEVTINVVITDNPVKYRQSLCKLGLPEVRDEFTAIHTSYYNIAWGQHWIILPKSVEIQTISHEVLHCVEAIDEYFGINSQEFRAYLLGYLVSKIHGRLS